jgi:hypothetical protein
MGVILGKRFLFRWKTILPRIKNYAMCVYMLNVV